MIFSDSHCHLDRAEPEQLTEALEQARISGVDIIVTMGMDLESSVQAVRIARSQSAVLAAAGIHPWNAVLPDEKIWESLSEMAEQDCVAAIGEIGLDYVRNPETADVQKELLIHELFLARQMDLPVNVHCREAHQDMMSILRPEVSSGLQGIIHGFSGDMAELKDWLDLGFYISIGIRGIVTDPIPSLLEAVKEIPVDRLLTETDAAFTGQTTSPLDVISVVEALASVRGTTAQEIADAATANLRRILKK